MVRTAVLFTAREILASGFRRRTRKISQQSYRRVFNSPRHKPDNDKRFLLFKRQYLLSIMVKPTSPMMARLRLTTKQVGPGYYKGNRTGSMGYFRKRKYVIDYSKVRTYVVPEGLADFKVRPNYQSRKRRKLIIMANSSHLSSHGEWSRQKAPSRKPSKPLTDILERCNGH